MAKSNTIFLIICSNTKRRGGTNTYDDAAGLAASIGKERGRKLIQTRHHIWGLIKQESEVRDSLMVADLPRNRNLEAGPDFGGTSTAARYLPAARRYTGSFYRAIGPDAAQLLTSSRHHILILSGLYGLLRPAESIQDYSCHVNDHPEIRPSWVGERLLTDILLDYSKLHSITQVFDFTALADYRRLVNWNTLARSQLSVWHAFGRQTVGDGLLTPLGDLLGQWLRADNDDSIDQIAAGRLTEVSTDTEQILFTPDTEPPAGFPREVVDHTRLTRQDEVVRLARGLKYLLARQSNTSDMTAPGTLVERLKRNRSVDTETAAAMHRIIARRNHVEHDAYNSVAADSLAEQRRDYALVRKWAKQQKLWETLPPEYR